MHRPQSAFEDAARIEDAADVANVMQVYMREGEVSVHRRCEEVFACHRSHTAVRKDAACGQGILHVDGVGQGFALVQVRNFKLLDGEGQWLPAFALDFKEALVHHEPFDHGVRAFEICALAGRKVFVVFLAADCRHSDVEAGNVHQFDTLAEHDEVGPCAFNDHRIDMSQRRQVGRIFAFHGDAGRDKSRSRKVNAVVTGEGHITGKHVLEHGRDLAVTIGPFCADEGGGCRQQSSDYYDHNMDPQGGFVPDAAYFSPDTAARAS